MVVFPGKALRSRLVADLDRRAAKAARAGSIDTAVRYWGWLLRFGYRNSLVPVARELAGQGKFDMAFRLLLAAIGGKGKVAATATEEYRIFCDWLGSAGYVKEAESRMATLPDQSVKGAGDWYVDFWHRRSILDPQNGPKLRHYLTENPDRETTSKILWLIYMTDGPTAEVHGLYEKAARGGNRLAAAEWLSILAATDRERFLKLLAEKPDWYPKKGVSLAMALALAEASPPQSDLLDERSRKLAQHFRQSSEVIWARLTDPSVSVAVVGNSPIERGSGKGAEIDGHDVVIRFNRPEVEPQYQADYGRKTDMMVMNATTLRPSIDVLTMPFIVTSKDWEIFTTNRHAVFDLADRGVPFTTIPAAIRAKINGALKATASSGTQTLAALAEARGGNGGLGIYGFSLVDQIGAEPTSSNFFRNSRPAANHNWRGEAMLLEAIRKDGRIDPVLVQVGAERYANQWKTIEKFRPPRFRLEGDHSNYHCGSAAVTRSMLHALAPKGVVVEKGDYDVMVLNGEGTMHHGAAGFHRKMKLLRKALEAGKAAYLVNTVWQDNPHDYDDVLKALDGITVREVLSQRELWEKHGIKARLHPDLAYYAPLEKARNPVDYKGSIVLTDFFSTEFDAFVRLTRAEALKYPFVDMLSVGWDDLIASLKTAEMIVTGRHHAVFAACRAEIPFVAFGGNTHKIQGIFQSAGVNIPLCESRAKLPEMIEWVRNNQAEYDKLFAWLKSFKGLTL